jgi:hypothetical protein
MQQTTLRHVLIAAGVLLVVSVVGLWSWNTLAALFDIPTAEFRHALAFLALLAIVRIAVLQRRHRRKQRVSCSHRQII